VREITKNQDGYKAIVIAVFVFVCSLYVCFGYFCVNAWGEDMKTPLVTDQLPDGWISYTILFLFALNLVFSYPLVLYPSNIIVENILYAGWEKSPIRQMFKNTSRTTLVFLTCIVTIMLGDKLDKFMSIVGALTCTPIAFTFPAMFHLKACAETTCEKIIDVALIIFSAVVIVYCTTQSVINFNIDEEKPLIDYKADFS